MVWSLLCLQEVGSFRLLLPALKCTGDKRLCPPVVHRADWPKGTVTVCYQ